MSELTAAVELTEQEEKRIFADVIERLGPFRGALRRKDWEPLREYVRGARISIKGVPREIGDLEHLVLHQTRPVFDLEIVVETVHEKRIQPHKASFRLRAAVFGKRLDGAGRDGIIVDCFLVFVLTDSGWGVKEIFVECPPLWAQWNSRPNVLAPVQYWNL